MALSVHDLHMAWAALIKAVEKMLPQAHMPLAVGQPQLMEKTQDSALQCAAVDVVWRYCLSRVNKQAEKRASMVL